MDEISFQRLFGFRHAFDQPVTLALTVGVSAGLVIAYLVILALGSLGKVTPAHYDELKKRMNSWFIIAPLMGVPVLLGGAWVMLAVAVLSLFCYREFARATGMFRDRAISAVVVIGILLVTLAIADNWYNFFLALPALVIVTTGVYDDRVPTEIPLTGGDLSYVTSTEEGGFLPLEAPPAEAIRVEQGRPMDVQPGAPMIAWHEAALGELYVDAARASDVLGAGAHGIAAVRGVWDSRDPAEAVRRYREAIAGAIAAERT